MSKIKIIIEVFFKDKNKTDNHTWSMSGLGKYLDLFSLLKTNEIKILDLQIILEMSS